MSTEIGDGAAAGGEIFEIVVNIDELTEKQKLKEYKAVQKDVKSKDPLAKLRGLLKLKDLRYLTEGGCMLPLINSVVVKKKSLEATSTTIDHLLLFLERSAAAVEADPTSQTAVQTVARALSSVFQSEKDLKAFKSLSDLIAYKEEVKKAKSPKKNKRDANAAAADGAVPDERPKEDPFLKGLRLRTLKVVYNIIRALRMTANCNPLKVAFCAIEGFAASLFEVAKSILPEVTAEDEDIKTSALQFGVYAMNSLAFVCRYNTDAVAAFSVDDGSFVRIISRLAKEESFFAVDCFSILECVSKDPIGVEILAKHENFVSMNSLLQTSGSVLVEAASAAAAAAAAPVKGGKEVKKKEAPPKKGAPPVVEAIDPRETIDRQELDPKVASACAVKLLCASFTAVASAAVPKASNSTTTAAAGTTSVTSATSAALADRNVMDEEEGEGEKEDIQVVEVDVEEVKNLAQFTSSLLMNPILWEVVRGKTDVLLGIDLSDALDKIAIMLGSFALVSAEVRKACCEVGAVTNSLRLLKSSREALAAVPSEDNNNNISNISNTEGGGEGDGGDIAAAKQEKKLSRLRRCLEKCVLHLLTERIQPSLSTLAPAPAAPVGGQVDAEVLGQQQQHYGAAAGDGNDDKDEVKVRQNKLGLRWESSFLRSVPDHAVMLASRAKEITYASASTPAAGGKKSKDAPPPPPPDSISHQTYLLEILASSGSGEGGEEDMDLASRGVRIFAALMHDSPEMSLLDFIAQSGLDITTTTVTSAAGTVVGGGGGAGGSLPQKLSELIESRGKLVLQSIETEYRIKLNEAAAAEAVRVKRIARAIALGVDDEGLQRIEAEEAAAVAKAEADALAAALLEEQEREAAAAAEAARIAEEEEKRSKKKKKKLNKEGEGEDGGGASASPTKQSAAGEAAAVGGADRSGVEDKVDDGFFVEEVIEIPDLLVSNHFETLYLALTALEALCAHSAECVVTFGTKERISLFKDLLSVAGPTGSQKFFGKESSATEVLVDLFDPRNYSWLPAVAAEDQTAEKERDSVVLRTLLLDILTIVALSDEKYRELVGADASLPLPPLTAALPPSQCPTESSSHTVCMVTIDVCCAILQSQCRFSLSSSSSLEQRQQQQQQQRTEFVTCLPDERIRVETSVLDASISLLTAIAHCGPVGLAGAIDSLALNGYACLESNAQKEGQRVEEEETGGGREEGGVKNEVVNLPSKSAMQNLLASIIGPLKAIGTAEGETIVEGGEVGEEVLVKSFSALAASAGLQENSFQWTRPQFFSDILPQNSEALLLTTRETIAKNPVFWPFLVVSSSLACIIADPTLSQLSCKLAIQALQSLIKNSNLFEEASQPILMDALAAAFLSIGGGVALIGSLSRFGVLSKDGSLDREEALSCAKYLFERGSCRQNFWETWAQEHKVEIPLDPKTGKPIKQKEVVKKDAKKDAKKDKNYVPPLIPDVLFNAESTEEKPDPNRGPDKLLWKQLLEIPCDDLHEHCAGSVPLISAVQGCNLPQVASILISEKVDLDLRDESSGHRTALMYALLYGEVGSETAIALMDNGANLDLLDAAGNPTIKYALLSLQSNDVAKTFVKGHLHSSSSLSDREDGVLLRTGKSGKGKTEDNKQEDNKMNGGSGGGVIQLLGSPSILDTFLKSDVDKLASDSLGYSPILISMGLGEMEVTIGGYKILICNSSYTTTKNNNSSNNNNTTTTIPTPTTPDFPRETTLDIVTKLIDAEATLVNFCSKSGIVPLHIAAARGHVEMIKLLLARNALPNAMDQSGFLPIHFVSTVCPVLSSPAPSSIYTSSSSSVASPTDLAELAIDTFDVLIESSLHRPIEKMSFQDERTGKSIAQKKQIDVAALINHTFNEAFLPSVIAKKRLDYKDLLLTLTADGMNVLQLALAAPKLFLTSTLKKMKRRVGVAEAGGGERRGEGEKKKESQPLMNVFLETCGGDKYARMQFALHLAKCAAAHSKNSDSDSDGRLRLFSNIADATGMNCLHAAALLFEGLTPKRELTAQEKRSKRVKTYPSMELHLLDLIFTFAEELNVSARCSAEISLFGQKLPSFWTAFHVAVLQQNSDLVESLLETSSSDLTAVASCPYLHMVANIPSSVCLVTERHAELIVQSIVGAKMSGKLGSGCGRKEKEGEENEAKDRFGVAEHKGGDEYEVGNEEGEEEAVDGRVYWEIREQQSEQLLEKRGGTDGEGGKEDDGYLIKLLNEGVSLSTFPTYTDRESDNTTVVEQYASTPLTLCVQSGQKHLLRALLSSEKVDANKLDPVTGRTALHTACLLDDAQLLREVFAGFAKHINIRLSAVSPAIIGTDASQQQHFGEYNREKGKEEASNGAVAAAASVSSGGGAVGTCAIDAALASNKTELLSILLEMSEDDVIDYLIEQRLPKRIAVDEEREEGESKPEKAFINIDADVDDIADGNGVVGEGRAGKEDNWANSEDKVSILQALELEHLRLGGLLGFQIPPGTRYHALTGENDEPPGGTGEGNGEGGVTTDGSVVLSDELVARAQKIGDKDENADADLEDRGYILDAGKEGREYGGDVREEYHQPAGTVQLASSRGLSFGAFVPHPEQVHDCMSSFRRTNKFLSLLLPFVNASGKIEEPEAFHKHSMFDANELLV